MDEAPVEEVLMARYAEKWSHLALTENVPGCSVKTSKASRASGTLHHIWINPEYEEELYATYPNLDTVIELRKKNIAVEGRIITDIAIPLRTCGGEERPEQTYRVIHDGQPNGGLRARGYGKIVPNPAVQQIQFMKHFTPTSIDLSPFLSVWTEEDDAIRMAAEYEARGETNVRIVNIDMTSEAWNHQEQRLWKAEYICRRFRLSELLKRHSIKKECVIENEIPQGSYEIYSWDELKEQLDPEGTIRAEGATRQSELKKRSARRRQKTKRVWVERERNWDVVNLGPFDKARYRRPYCRRAAVTKFIQIKNGQRG
ncbi:hypothetical protein F5Y15DRAFT_414362 [Xylariaceae sp. FL0016]|nr:hypothetical protein F5Y15DRAFT_414362 [Xylariaceae sp. FL0016]